MISTAFFMSAAIILIYLFVTDVVQLNFGALLDKVTSKSTGKNFVTNVYWNYL